MAARCSAVWVHARSGCSHPAVWHQAAHSRPGARMPRPPTTAPPPPCRSTFRRPKRSSPAHGPPHSRASPNPRRERWPCSSRRPPRPLTCAAAGAAKHRVVRVALVRLCQHRLLLIVARGAAAAVAVAAAAAAPTAAPAPAPASPAATAGGAAAGRGLRGWGGRGAGCGVRGGWRVGWVGGQGAAREGGRGQGGDMWCGVAVRYMEWLYDGGCGWEGKGRRAGGGRTGGSLTHLYHHSGGQGAAASMTPRAHSWRNPCGLVV